MLLVIHSEIQTLPEMLWQVQNAALREGGMPVGLPVKFFRCLREFSYCVDVAGSVQ